MDRINNKLLHIYTKLIRLKKQSFIEEKSKKLAAKIWISESFSWVIEKEAHRFKPILNLKLSNKVVPISASSGNAFKAVNSVFEKAKRIIRSSHQKQLKSL